MAKLPHDKGELRAAFLMGELEMAKRNVQRGPAGVLVRLTLAVIFMNLIVISYAMLGIVGPMFMSVLFLAACLTPCLYQLSRRAMERRRLRKDERGSQQEAQQRG